MFCNKSCNNHNFNFFRNITTTIIPFLTVPISILSTFIFLNFFGYTLNLITLLALVLCTGLVIDDSIVMLENIYKKLSQDFQKLKLQFRVPKRLFLQLFQPQ